MVINVTVNDKKAKEVNSKVKIRQSPPNNEPVPKLRVQKTKVSAYQSRGSEEDKKDILNFTTDMKRLGLMADIQNV